MLTKVDFQIAFVYILTVLSRIRPFIRLKGFCFLLYKNLLWLVYKPKRTGLFWYEDNNLGVNGGYPADFFTKFNTPEWDEVGKHIDVYLLHMVVLSKTPDSFIINDLLPYLKKHNIKLALDAEGATWTQWGGRQFLFDREYRLLSRLRQLKVPVDYICLQSSLCKTIPDKSVYSMQQRLADIKHYQVMAKLFYENVEIGLIDANPTHQRDWEKVYTQVAETVGCDFLLLDSPYHLVKHVIDALTWYEINQVSDFTKNHGWEFGLLLTTEAGSNTEFITEVETMQLQYNKCIPTGNSVLTSWFTYPDVTIPLITSLISRLKMRFFK